MPRERSTARAQERVAATRDGLVQAAATVFAERGYHPTRVSDIAEQAGVGQGTFYRHFSDKRQILDAVVAGTAERLQSVFTDENAPEQIDSLAEYRERASDMATRVFELIAAEHREMGFLLGQLPSVDDDGAATLDFVHGIAAAMIAEYYRIGIERGFFRADLDIDAASIAVIGMGLSAAWKILRNPADTGFRAQYRETVVEFIVRYAAVDPTIAN
ncbi:TetR/AcrR family transcriptional regulator [Nocardia sp. NPDC056000]|uniref:TetR/AcrR family transcriptional regulator n=1 Tax=Nocardia sp. NPDC056000 TaxID=3345674 RepID=UPI0035E21C14